MTGRNTNHYTIADLGINASNRMVFSHEDINKTPGHGFATALSGPICPTMQALPRKGRPQKQTARETKAQASMRLELFLDMDALPCAQRIIVDTLEFEPRAFRMRSGCGTTTPCALVICGVACLGRPKSTQSTARKRAMARASETPFFSLRPCPGDARDHLRHATAPNHTPRLEMRFDGSS